MTEYEELMSKVPTGLRAAIEGMSLKDANEAHQYLFITNYRDCVSGLMMCLKSRITRPKAKAVATTAFEEVSSR